MLLTLDLATRTGWTLGHYDDPRFRIGHHDLPKTGPLIGDFAREFHRWLAPQFTNGGITHVVFESPILPKKTRIETIRKLTGLAWHTEYLCACYGISVEEANIGRIKKFVTGDHRAKKPQMVEGIRQMGFPVTIHDEADAIGIRLMWLSVNHPEVLKAWGHDLGMLGIAAKGRLANG